MKKQISVLMSLSMCFLLSTNSFAINNTEGPQLLAGNSVKLTAEGKIAFANRVTQQYRNQANLASTSPTYDIDEINTLMIEVAFADDVEDQAFYLHKLESLGVYQYPVETSIQPSPLSDSGDVSIGRVDVYYSVQENVWVVTNSGFWLTDDWQDDRSMISNEVGGPDGFGVGFTETKNYESYVVRSMGVLRNGLSGDAQRTSITYNRSDGDGKAGFGFKLQDYTEMVSGVPGQAQLSTTYIGHEWFASCTYSSEFSSYEGIATGYYIHTWDDAVISSITFGVSGKQAGIEVEMTNEACYFPAFGPDTKF